MSKIKVYLVGNDSAYMNFITSGCERVATVSGADIVLFTGGHDVSPNYYGENKGKYTSYNSDRDDAEQHVFSKAKSLGKLCVGICRGAQFLTVMSGGTLIQHVTGHCNGDHNIKILDEGREFKITSTHHQMLYPFHMNPNEYKIIACASENLSSTYLNGNNNETYLSDIFVEPEIVWYPESNCLAIQGHPEYMDKDSEAVRFINVLIDELLEEPAVVADKAKPVARLNRGPRWLLANEGNLDDVREVVNELLEARRIEGNNVF